MMENHNSEYNCDRCGVYVPDGDGFYFDIDDNDDRVCGECNDVLMKAAGEYWKRWSG